MVATQISQENLVTGYSAQTVVELRQESMWMMLTSQTDTGRWAAGTENKCVIPIPNFAPAGSGNTAAGVLAEARRRHAGS